MAGMSSRTCVRLVKHLCGGSAISTRLDIVGGLPRIGPAMTRQVFLTGATGYMGSRLIPLLTQRGHGVAALVRPGSAKKVPAGVRCVEADPLQMDAYSGKIQP